MTAGPRRLIVLRHAKSAWPPGVLDEERPLGPRGRRDARVAGQWLRASACLPDAVVCSPARRTRETWELAGRELREVPDVVFDPRVYEASGGQLLAVVRETAGSLRTLLLIGHNPGVQDLVLTLANHASADHQLAQAREKFPTSAIAVLSLPSAWKDLAPHNAVLTDFAIPRDQKT